MLTMKSLKNTAACVVVLMLVSGCATTFRPWSLSEIKEGMDRSQVVSILGEPDRVESKDGSEFLYYSYSEESTTPLTEEMIQAYESDRTLRRQVASRIMKEYNYSVKMVDGKVQTYTELQK